MFANAAIYLLTQSLKSLPLGTAFAVFTGIGAIGSTLIGVLHFQESASPARLFNIVLILTGDCRSQVAESLTLRIRKEQFHGTTASCRSLAFEERGHSIHIAGESLKACGEKHRHNEIDMIDLWETKLTPSMRNHRVHTRAAGKMGCGESRVAPV
jgi:hypothetical protein